MPMPAPADPDPFFPGFEAGRLAVGDAEIFFRRGGSGPPLYLLHGFPQTGVMWAGVAAALAQTRTLIIPDLRGYGASRGPEGAEGYAKRILARDVLALADALGHARFDIAGHDRGARVSYRLALDAPERVGALAVLDITPTLEYWRRFSDPAFAVSIAHWPFLAQPYPIPEQMVGLMARDYCFGLLEGWAGEKGLAAFEPEALEVYAAAMADPRTRRAMFDDYRAGAFIDPDHDAADEAAGRRIAAPTLVMWGGSGIAAKSASPLSVWERWVSGPLTGVAAPSGHFIPEEAPDESIAALRAHFAA